MNILIVSFSTLPVYASSLVIQGKYLNKEENTYLLGSSKFKNLFEGAEVKDKLIVDTPDNPRPSLDSYKLFNKVYKQIIDFIEKNEISDVYFINKHIWNLLLILKIKKMNIKIFHCLHDPLGHSGDKISKGVYYYNKVLVRYLDGIVVLSKNSFFETKNVLKPKCEIIQLPLIQTEWNEFTPLKNNKNILFFGRLNNYKGLDFIPEISKRLYELDKEIEITIAGKRSDDVDENLINLIKKCPNVHLNEKFIKEEDVDNYYNNASLILLPYRSITQSGIIVDAYNHSRTLVCFKIKGIDEFVSKDNAIIIESYNVEEMCLQINEILKNREKLERLSKSSYELGKALYSPESFSKEFINFIKKLSI